MTVRYISVAIVVAVFTLAGCSSDRNNTRQIHDLQATVAALSARTPQAITVTASPAPDTPTPTPVPATPEPTPEVYQLSGSISAPKCDGGYNLTHSSVTIRDEHATVIGSATTGENVIPFPTPIPAAEKSEIDRYRKEKGTRDTAQLFDPSGRLRPTAIVLPLPIATSDAAGHDDQAYQKASSTYFSVCSATFAVTVPKAGFYQVAIGTHGGPSYSFDEMRAMGFKLDLSLK